MSISLPLRGSRPLRASYCFTLNCPNSCRPTLPPPCSSAPMSPLAGLKTALITSPAFARDRPVRLASSSVNSVLFIVAFLAGTVWWEASQSASSRVPSARGLPGHRHLDERPHVRALVLPGNEAEPCDRVPRGLREIR